MTCLMCVAFDSGTGVVRQCVLITWCSDVRVTVGNDVDVDDGLNWQMCQSSGGVDMDVLYMVLR